MSDVPRLDKRTKPKKHSAVRETVETIVVAALLALGIRATVAEARSIPSESMLPALQIGDHLIVEKITPHFSAPARGEILVFYPPDNPGELSTTTRLLRMLSLSGDMALIKRVVGLPGETIAVEDGQVTINGQPLEEPYLREAPIYSMAPRQIPEGYAFMMGDNRNNSLDSHVWGPMPLDNVIGQAVFRFWPVHRIGPLDRGGATLPTAQP